MLSATNKHITERYFKSDPKYSDTNFLLNSDVKKKRACGPRRKLSCQGSIFTRRVQQLKKILQIHSYFFKIKKSFEDRGLVKAAMLSALQSPFGGFANKAEVY
jgi:hypothetical protein